MTTNQLSLQILLEIGRNAKVFASCNFFYQTQSGIEDTGESWDSSGFTAFLILSL